jgi:5-(carboxyamino)imidazole ribonucleotide synthase
LHPSPNVVRICQDRILEKEFLQSHGFPVAPFRVITSVEELVAAVGILKSHSILKTAMLGYDGKGQISLSANASSIEIEQAWKSLRTQRAVLEKRIHFQAEGSVIVARSSNGTIRSFPPQENNHVGGILDVSRAPARFSPKVLGAAEELGCRITEALEVVGLLTIEFFVLSNDEIMVNELAPRPHNSGHHTIESSKTSQFEQAVRAVTGVALESTELVRPAIMLNLLGDLWCSGESDWNPFLEHPEIFLHLYGKKEAKPGRKMGHVTFIGEHREELLEQAKQHLKNEPQRNQS